MHRRNYIPEWTESKAQKAVNLYAEHGMTVIAISKRFCVPIQYIQRALDAAGIVRDKNGARKYWGAPIGKTVRL